MFKLCKMEVQAKVIYHILCHSVGHKKTIVSPKSVVTVKNFVVANRIQKYVCSKDSIKVKSLNVTAM